MCCESERPAVWSRCWGALVARSAAGDPLGRSADAVQRLFGPAEVSNDGCLFAIEFATVGVRESRFYPWRVATVSFGMRESAWPHPRLNRKEAHELHSLVGHRPGSPRQVHPPQC